MVFTSTGLVKIICKENKEQRGKRKYHDGTPHPKDRGGFTQWFGSCSLINTLYVWFPASWAPIVAEQLFERSSKSDDLSNNIQHGQPARGLSQNPSRGHAWHQTTHEFAGPSGTATEAENNEVMYKIWRWSLPGAAVMPVLNVSSRVTWLELDDKALLDSFAVLQEGTCAMSFRKSAQRHGKVLQGKGLRSPLCCLADNWQMNGLTSCFHKGTCGPRDERLWGARRFHHFCEDFHRLCFVCFFVFVGFVFGLVLFVGLCLFCLL